MANIYVRSSDGSDADNGSTWALAKATLSGAAAIDAAGDSIYLSDAHSESTGAAITIALAGTTASPVRVIGVDDTSDPEPPTAVATTPIVATGAGNYAITISAVAAYFYGVKFRAGVSAGGGTPSIIMNSATAGDLLFESCLLELAAGLTTPRIAIGSTSANPSAGRVRLKNTEVKFASTSQRITLIAASLEMQGGSFSGSAVTTLLETGSTGRLAAGAEFSGVDMSGLAATVQLTSCAGPGLIVFRNCKLPASWSGNLVGSAGAQPPGCRVEMHNCDNADTNYRMWVEDYAGSIKSETTVVRTGGASDGTTTQSWKMVSSSNAEYPLIVLESPEIAQWNDTTGSSITATVEIVTDNVTLNDDECWIEVQYLGTSGYPVSSFISDCKADVLASAAAQTSSSETWTTTGLSTPVKQKLSVSFTPQEKGYIHAVVHLAKASTTVYVDPKITVT